MKKLVFATNNKHKLEELRAILGSTLTLLSLEDIHCDVDIPETANTLEGNAILKAKYIKEQYGLDCFADDTGLEIEALNNAPGVFSARYAGSDKDATANMNKVLDKLGNTTNRTAQFRTVIALMIGEETKLFEGIVKGQITTQKEGESGFGYDPIFQPEGYTKTFAQLGATTKNSISHRAKAVHQLCKFLTHLNV